MIRIRPIQLTSDVWNIVHSLIKQYCIGFGRLAADIQRKSTDYKTFIRSKLDPTKLNCVNNLI